MKKKLLSILLVLSLMLALVPAPSRRTRAHSKAVSRGSWTAPVC